MKFFTRAIHDTFEGRFSRTIFIMIVGAGCTYLALSYILGSEVAMSEAPHFLAGLIGAIAPLTMLFSWNLVCAPYRIERDKRRELESELAKLKATLPEVPKARRLTNGQQEALASDLAGIREFPDRVPVVYFSASDECADFAEDIGRAFKKASISCTVHNGAIFPHDPKARGVIALHSKDEQSTKLAGEIKAALESAGIKASKALTERDENGIALYVARCPVQHPN